MTLFTKQGLAGRGVFTDAPIQRGAMVEVCPILEVPQEVGEHPSLFFHSFTWKGRWSENRGSEASQHGDKNCLRYEGSYAVVLGFGFLYNHSYEPNAHFEKDFQTDTLRFVADRDVAAGEEIFINYNGQGWLDHRASVGFLVEKVRREEDLR